MLSDTPTRLLMSVDESHTPSALLSVDSAGLRIEVSEPDEEGQQFFSAIHQWALIHEATWPVRLWCKAGPMLGTVLGVVSFAFLLLSFGTDSEVAFKAEGRQILSEGIGDANRDRALAILLALASNYPHQQGSGVNTIVLKIAGVLAVLGLLIGFPPTFVLGVGIGQRRLTRWRRWIALVSVGVPTTIILPILLDYVMAAF